MFFWNTFFSSNLVRSSTGIKIIRNSFWVVCYVFHPRTLLVKFGRSRGSVVYSAVEKSLEKILKPSKCTALVYVLSKSRNLFLYSTRTFFFFSEITVFFPLAITTLETQLVWRINKLKSQKKNICIYVFSISVENQ